jgi:hypothetical protein
VGIGIVSLSPAEVLRDVTIVPRLKVQSPWSPLTQKIHGAQGVLGEVRPDLLGVIVGKFDAKSVARDVGDQLTTMLRANVLSGLAALESCSTCGST